MSVGRLGCVLCALTLTGCPGAAIEPPPPARKADVAVAPPHALGALAAGTDAAPRPDTTLSVPDGEEPVAPLPPPPGALPDAGAAPPAAAPPSPPDAGMAL